LIQLDVPGIIGLLALAQAILLCAYVALINYKNITGWLLVIFLITVVIGLGHDILLQTRIAIWLPQILGFGPFASYLVGPLILLLVLKLVFPEKALNRWHGLHFIPFVMQLIDRWPIISQTSETKLAILQSHFNADTSPVSHFNFDWPTLSNLILFYGHRLAYLGIAIGLLYSNRKQFQHAVAARTRFSRMLFILLIGYISAWSILRVGLFIPDIASWLFENQPALHSIALSGLTIGLALFLFSHPLNQVFSAKSTQKYQQSALDSDSQASIWQEIEQHILSKQLYSQPDLKQSQLATQLGISSQLLSQVINSSSGYHFNDYMNSLRIDRIKKLLENDGKSDIQEMALECGFSSKATFYRVFKKWVGCTPTEFRKRLENN